MGYANDTANQENQRTNPYDLRSSGGPNAARDAYEFGTIMGVSRTGRYKVFANPFTARPSVVCTTINTAPSGTILPRFIGTPALGSFRVAAACIAAGGSAQMHYVAFGAR